MVAARKISAADASSEEDVAAVEEVGRFLQEADMARAVAGDMEDLEIDTFDDLRWGFLGEKVGLDRLNFPIESEFLEEIGFGHKGRGVRVITDFASMLALNAGSIPNMVDVAVGKEKGFDGIPLIAEPFCDVLGGID